MMTLFSFMGGPKVLADLVVQVVEKVRAAVVDRVEEARGDLLADLAVADRVEAAGIVPNGLDDQTDRS